jgi:hypothetical protein
LAPKTDPPLFGYFINFPTVANGFLPKGINTPMVVAGSLFYSYFAPEDADPCTGGSGKTYSWMMSDVVNPIVTDTRSNVSAKSGLKDVWASVSSDYFALGTRGVLQGGVVPNPNPPPGASKTTPEIHTTLGAQQQRYPKALVWRTVR